MPPPTPLSRLDGEKNWMKNDLKIKQQKKTAREKELMFESNESVSFDITPLVKDTHSKVHTVERTHSHGNTHFAEQSNKNGMRENKAKRLHIILYRFFAVLCCAVFAAAADAVVVATNEYKQIIRRNNG